MALLMWPQRPGATIVVIARRPGLQSSVVETRPASASLGCCPLPRGTSMRPQVCTDRQDSSPHSLPPFWGAGFDSFDSQLATLICCSEFTFFRVPVLSPCSTGKLPLNGSVTKSS